MRIVPVSKRQPVASVRELYDLGYRRFGENLVQATTARVAETTDLAGIEWALIGHLQRNKVRDAVRVAAEFQALDSLDLAAALDRRLAAEGRSLDVLVEVNSSGEPSKFGLPPAEVPALAAELPRFPRLHVRGLMTLAANTPDAGVVAACFERMVALRELLRRTSDLEWDELSMGMSADYELAIQHGATCVRIGTALFGSRS